MLRENSSHLNVFTSPTAHHQFAPSQDKENCFQPQPQPLPQVDIAKIKEKLMVVFTFYASFGDRRNLKLLKSNKFHKMMGDANVKDGRLTQKRLDLLFMAESQHRAHIDFTAFLSLLIKVASYKYCVEDSLSLRKILNDHFEPLYDNIIEMTDLGNERTRFEKEMDPSLIDILMEVSQTLSRVYLAYFPWEPKSFQQKIEIRKRSEGSLLSFLKDFEICPAILTKSKSFLMFNEVVEMDINDLRRYFPKEDVGTCLTFGRFLVFLCRVALNFENVEPAVALRSLLERMELSSGFMSLEKKINVTFNSKLSLTSSHGRNNNSSMNMNNINNNNNLNNSNAMMVNSNNNNNYSQNSNNFQNNNKENSIISNKTHTLNNINLPEELEDPVRRVFSYYCSMGEPLNTKLLKSIKFKRFFKEIGLNTIDSNLLDLLFIKLKGKTGKMEFEGFLHAISLVNEKIYGGADNEEGDDSLGWFIKTYLLDFADKINQSNQESRPENYVQLLMDLLQDSEILDLLGTVHKSLKYYYEAYTNGSPNNLMNFETFAKFAKDFDIFPTILTKAKLLKIFETLAGVFQKTGNFQHSNDNKLYIDQHLFIEGLALCAFEVNYQEPEPSNFDKVYYFLEKINQSEGVVNIQKVKGVGVKSQNWDLLQEFRRKTIGNSSMNRSRSSGVGTGIGGKERMDFDSLLRK